MLEFDAETSRLLEDVYAGGDFTRRRRCSFDALAPRPGETLLDIGCGGGHLCADLARAVGPKGRVIGVDPSNDMRKGAAGRVDGLDWVSIRDGAADALPVEAGLADGAVSLQVFEYLDDVPGALSELYRALRPGGRVAIGDMQFDTLSWFSDAPERMARMTASWDTHVADTGLPARLPALLDKAGFEVDAVTPLTFCDHALRPDGVASLMLLLMERYAVQKGHVPADEARAWAEEQQALATEGRFFFLLTHVVVSARKRPV